MFFTSMKLMLATQALPQTQHLPLTLATPTRLEDHRRFRAFGAKKRCPTSYSFNTLGHCCSHLTYLRPY